MKKLTKILCVVMVMMMAIAVIPGCKKSSPEAGGDKTADGRVIVNFWHNVTGEQEKRVQERVDAFNASQDKYEVVALSSPDTQKLVAAVSAGEGPDVFTVLGESVVPYAAQGILEPLDAYIKKDGIDINEHWDKTVIGTGIYKDSVYGFPNYNQIIGMFYNKKILRDNGYDPEKDLPKTMEELYEMAVKCTKIGDDGEMEVLGFPMYPLKAYYLEGTYAFGGDLRPEGGKGSVVVPEEAIRGSLGMNMAYRDEFGKDVVERFVSAAQAARGTENDPWLFDKVAFMMNGLYTVQVIEDYAPEGFEYGIMPIPGGNGTPMGRTRLENGFHGIATTAKEKEGAWEFLKFETIGEGNIMSCLRDIKLPCDKLIAKDERILNATGFKEFLEIQALNQLVPFPVFEESGRLMNLLQTCYDNVYSGAMTIDQAITDMKNAAKDMKVE